MSQKRPNLLSLRKLCLMIIDLFCYSVVSAVLLYLFSLRFPQAVLEPLEYIKLLSVFYLIILLLRFAFRVYLNVWRYTNTRAYLEIVLADMISSCVILFILHTYKLHMLIIQAMVIMAFYCLMSLSVRFCYRLVYKKMHAKTDDHKINVAIVGAGQLGANLASELMTGSGAHGHYRPICFIDRDKAKKGSYVAGLRVLYEDEKIIENLCNMPIQEIFIAINHLDSDETARLYNFYSQTNCKVKVYEAPFYSQEEAGGQSFRKGIREFQIEDLLFRKPITVKNSETVSYYNGKTVLVTGGGGSIGSELCRQIAMCSPKRLIILDIYENNAYNIQQELIRKYGDKLDLKVEIASVRDAVRLDCIFAAYKPDVVFHAAAHKHVPLMEHSRCEAIKNNILGTYNSANCAEKHGAEKFILISTDKAVNPTNIMGASKRFCEMVVQCRTDSKTSFACVRFGNVLGSNGSVIPLFKSQIEKGGPITITDKRIIRYFMTIPEASQLVMQAGSMAKSGELFVLDMGKPVKIYDLAVNMIRLSGYRPNIDIMIEEVGLRPGEKLYEELLMKSQTLAKTENDLIFVEHDEPYTRGEVDSMLKLLVDTVEETKNELKSPKIKAVMKQVVSTYHDPEEVNEAAERSEEMQMVK